VLSLPTANSALEIRQEIYRYLLIPHEKFCLVPVVAPDLSSLSKDPEDEWVDEDSEMEDDDDDNIYDLLGGDGRQYIMGEEAVLFSAKDFEESRKHPAILRVNHQIYFEASSVLYSEGTLVIEPGDIFCLTNTRKPLKFGDRNENPWRHNPLKGVGKLNEKGQTIYNTPAMGGLMEPHVFARFQKITFDANFDFLSTQHIEMWINDETFVVNPEDAANFRKILRSSTIIKDFVKIISNSPKINSLKIFLEVELMVSSSLMMEEVPSDDEEADDAEERVDKLMDIGNERATEIFMDSNICEPLLKLTNVRNFEFRFFEDREDDERYTPLEKHMELIHEMKETIEANFKEPLISF